MARQAREPVIVVEERASASTLQRSGLVKDEQHLEVEELLEIFEVFTPLYLNLD